ncbi:DNA phosphorothioation-dependent restriction protein DptG [Anaerovirgula multivorans]|uniref:DNA phosphorothioation-dependent restriction protein DptG n=1 Tax=Anaerovirgula multivorans TaxID=312168 RepID=A0A239CJG9_9FIRM|nr:DNA phosphorothioation-dependent restriction protein DptG [Anaerovirgula multivorans]SNS20315.1 DNA phosphorothioation-dependent restriction protein DptG [Anaerovirgula multivorans]
MELLINIGEFKNRYFPSKDGKESVRHDIGKAISILPYTTKYESKHKEVIENFQYALGEFSRITYEKKVSDEEINLNNIDNYIAGVEIEDQDKTALKSILKELFFTEDEIYTFYPLLFNYIQGSKGVKEYNNKLGKFLYDVLLGNDHKEILEKVKTCFDQQPLNVLERLMLNGLPKLSEDQSKKEIQYYNSLPFISKIFKEDLSFMLEDTKFFLSGFQMLLKYYYFFYVAQLSLKFSKLCHMEIDNEEMLFFNLDWETTSKTRTSYMRGWKMLESNMRALFSHANTLEILNTKDHKQCYDYWGIKQQIINMNTEEKSQFSNSIKDAINIYKQNIKDIDWNKFNFSTSHEDEIYDHINELFRTIDYQFNESKTSRKKAYNSYAKWFEEFCKSNFLRKRGSLGYTLNITQEYLLFLTKLCIKNQDKMKLKDLFEAYTKRGLYFDRDSQTKIIQLFEKLNLIEKKSDSGDAQYVKSIL